LKILLKDFSLLKKAINVPEKKHGLGQTIAGKMEQLGRSNSSYDGDVDSCLNQISMGSRWQ